jgi:hypothetical protein
MCGPRTLECRHKKRHFFFLEHKPTTNSVWRTPQNAFTDTSFDAPNIVSEVPSSHQGPQLATVHLGPTSSTRMSVETKRDQLQRMRVE